MRTISSNRRWASLLSGVAVALVAHSWVLIWMNWRAVYWDVSPVAAAIMAGLSGLGLAGAYRGVRRDSMVAGALAAMMSVMLTIWATGNTTTYSELYRIRVAVDDLCAGGNSPSHDAVAERARASREFGFACAVPGRHKLWVPLRSHGIPGVVFLVWTYDYEAGRFIISD